MKISSFYILTIILIIFIKLTTTQINNQGEYFTSLNNVFLQLKIKLI